MIALIISLLAQHATCSGRAVLSHGVSPQGAFDCVEWPKDDGSERNDVQPIAVQHRRIFCRRGTVPIVEIDGRSVRCRRIGAQS